MDFLKDEVEGETLITLASQGFQTKEETPVAQDNGSRLKLKKDKFMDQLPTAMGLVSLDERLSCAFCRKNHATRNCWSAVKLSLEERKKIVQANGLCFNCLEKGHISRTCGETVMCEKCGGKHLQVLCNKNVNFEHEDVGKLPLSPNVQNPLQENKIELSQANFTSSRDVLVPTLVIGIKCRDGKLKRVRAAIDTMSGRSYIRKELAQELKLVPKQKVTFNHAVFGGNVVEVEHYQYPVTVTTLNGTFSCTIEVFDQEQISAGIPGVPGAGVIEELKGYGIFISDSNKANMIKEMDLLIGVDIAGKLLTGRILQLKAGPTAIETRFGWTVMGQPPRLPVQNKTTFTVNSLVNLQSPSVYWDLEAIGIMDPAAKLSKHEEDLIAMDHFRKTVKRKEDGRYQVTLPWIEGHPPIPSNRLVAEKRLQSSLRKLEAQGKHEDYNAVFMEWKDMGIIELTSSDPEHGCHYFPHRPVFKPGSSTTKVRPVFDASCKGYGGLGKTELPSLNDCLVKGPNLLERIPDLLLRFREDKIAVTADIKKAFLMIEIDEKDRDFLRFLWVDEKKRITEFRHCRVVFGVNCSPFLLTAVIEHHLKTASPAEMSKTVKKLLSSLYVDNVVASFPTVEEYDKFREESISLLEEGKFELRLWESNVDDEVTSETTGVLGIHWNKAADTLACSVALEGKDQEKITKKNILSSLARVYDPLGMLSPVLLLPKIMMQRCWDKKIKWDDEVPEDVKDEFLNWLDQMKLSPIASIPRYMGVPTPESSVHIFCDASESGYAAVAYLRRRDDTNVTVSFIMARSRVSPLTKTTINRLELVSCEIATRLGETIKDALSWKDIPFTYWTDSTTAKAWITRNMDWGTFVGNRVRKIRAVTTVEEWRHVPGKVNPADLPSRGCGLNELLQSNWWKGPEWLELDPAYWPAEKQEENESEIIMEVKKGSTVTCVNVLVEEAWYSPKQCKVKTYSGLNRVMAYVFRFVNNARRRKNERVLGPLSVQELKFAENKLLWQVQQTSDMDVRSFPFSVVQDSEGLLRVETKLTYRDDETGFKTPIIIPGKHVVVKLLIKETHKIYCHAGVQFLLSKLRERVWLTGGRKAVEKVIKDCFICRRFKVQHPVPKTAPLPENRVKNASPFEVTGIDFAGPLYLKCKKKVWIALYTCAVYRAVHLELVTGLSTDVFLLSLRRFAARRGRPAIIYTDNGTNFTGASRQLKELDWKKIVEDSLVGPIEWIFSPPSAPWWGGFWERLVRTVKELLVRVLGKRVLDFEELATVLCDVEAVVNGRPLTHVFEGDTLVPLTPALFLHGNREDGMPDLDCIGEISFGKRLQLKQRLMEDLRKRFRREYLGQLVQRKKEERSHKFEPGDVVLIGSDGRKRVMWPTGVIEELIPGRDGISRIAKVRTAHGTLVRPLQRLYSMEITSKDMREMPELKIEKAIKTRSGREIKKPKYFQ